MKIIPLIGSLFFLCFCLGQPVNQTQLWFDFQLTDHFNITNNRTWSQRYWVHDQFYNPVNGSVLLYICGEYTCPGIPEERQFPLVLAEKFGSLVLVLEHRFYGESVPFGFNSLEQQHLYLLNVDQALADLAYFVTYVKDYHLHGVEDHIPWINIGGSYPGAMSAWFRSKYPQLTVGALASSAVVNAILNYTQMDEQVRWSALRSSEKCAQTIHDLNMFISNQIEESPLKAQEIKKQYGAEQLTNGEFLFYYADIFTETIQYGNRTVLCEEILNYPTLEEQYNSMLRFAHETDIIPESYGAYYLKNDTFDPLNDGGRQWTWQFCTEFGFFQTCPNVETGMRSPLVDMSMFTSLCQDTFSEEIYPNPNRVNIQYGGVHLQATNLILTNGIEDPWRWAGLQVSTGDIESYVIDCTDCAHCVELYTPKDSDAQVLKDTRLKIEQHFSKWINEHYNTLRQSEIENKKYSFIQNKLIKQ